MIDEKAVIKDIKEWRKEKEIKWTSESVISLLESSPKANQWIPCSERLPEEENKKVIVSAIWDGFEYTTESYFYHGKFYNKPYYQITAGEIQESYTGDKVIAWQPLPEPYREPNET